MRFAPMLLVLGLLTSVAAADGPRDRAALVQLLSAYERAPTARELRRVGPNLTAALIGIHGDRTQPAYVRMRALRAGAVFPTRSMRAYLLHVARDAEAPELHAREAVIALGEGYRSAVAADLVALLVDARPAVREGAVLGLTRSGSARAPSVLARHLEGETDEGVRHLIRRALGRVAAPGQAGVPASTEVTGPPAPR